MCRNSMLRSWLDVVLLAVMAVGAAVAYTPTQDPQSVQLSASVLLMGEYDWALSTGSNGKPWSRCLDMVWRARRYSNGNKLNIVPTHHWLPNSNGLGVTSYCYMHISSSGGSATCLPWTAAKLAEFKTSMTYCFTEAFRQGFVPYIRPHLDDGLLRGVWRNALLFSPTTKYGGYSFADIMTVPLAEAMRDAVAAAAKTGDLYTPPGAERPVVYMAFQGEMSATIMRFTSDWASLVPIIRTTIGTTRVDVKVGAGLNFNALDAVECAEGTSSSSGSSGIFGFLFGGTTSCNPNAPAIQAANVRDLFANQLDFLGISAYSPYTSASFALSEFNDAASDVTGHLSNLAGLNLQSLATSGKLELHYGEFGLGGGYNNLKQVSASADACAQQPWSGISGPYTTAMDPWQRSYLADFRRSFYTKAMQWLSTPSMDTFKVHEVFVWSTSSWDLFGIYPESGSYRDLAMVRKIAAYNTAVIAAQVCAYEGEAACSTFAADNTACLSDASGTACLDRSSSTTNSNVVTESGPAQQVSPAPAQQQASPSPAASSSPAPASTGTGANNAAGTSPAPVDGTYINMAPGGSSASSPSPNVAAIEADAASQAAAATKAGQYSSATSSRVWWVVTVLVPVLCSWVLLGH